MFSLKVTIIWVQLFQEAKTTDKYTNHLILFIISTSSKILTEERSLQGKI